MTDIKCVINDVKTGKSYGKPIDSAQLDGRKIGDTVPGSLFELAGYELKITGGSDNAGFPMKQELDTDGRKKMLLKKGDAGVHLKRQGAVVRKTVRGNIIREHTAQVNLAVTKHGTKKIDELLGKKEETAPKEGEAPKAEAAPKEEKKES